jgi:hypothetical protein
LIISKRVVESIFSDSNFFRFSINFADCKIEDYSKITFLNIYLFSPSFRRFYKIFSKIFSLSKRDFRLETIDVSSPSGTSEDYSNKPRAGKYTHSRTRHRDARSSSEKQITTTRLQQKKIFFYRFVAHILLNSLFKSKSNRRSLKVRKFFLSFFINFFKCKNLGVLNPLVFASFFKIFFFFFFNFIKRELQSQLSALFPGRYIDNRFRINFYFLKRYWCDIGLIARRVAFSLFSRRSLGSIVKPFQFVLLRKNKLIGLSKNAFRLQSMVEGTSRANKIFSKYYDNVFFRYPMKTDQKFQRLQKSLIKQTTFCKKRKFKFKLFRTRFFRASSQFILQANSRYRLGTMSSVFIKRESSLAACVRGSSFSRMINRGKPLFKWKGNIFRSSGFRTLFLNDFSSIAGMRVKGSGRFSKKQMAETLSFNIGSIHFSNPLSKVDFKYLQVSLKNSTVGLKLWLSFALNHCYLLY